MFLCVPIYRILLNLSRDNFGNACPWNAREMLKQLDVDELLFVDTDVCSSSTILRPCCLISGRQLPTHRTESYSAAEVSINTYPLLLHKRSLGRIATHQCSMGGVKTETPACILAKIRGPLPGRRNFPATEAPGTGWPLDVAGRPWWVLDFRTVG